MSFSEIRHTPHGAGLYATRDLARGTVVAQFAGPVVATDDIPDEEVVYALALDAHRSMIPSAPARWINHGCEPNCYVRDNLEVVTLRDVPAGRELTFDYALVDASDYYAAPEDHVWDPRWTFVCRCESPLCRGSIDGYTLQGSLKDLPPTFPMRVVEVEGKGRGVVAARHITAGELLEKAPVLVIPGRQWPEIEGTVLYDYVFEWGEDGHDAAVALGTGSIINHAYRPNANFVRRYAEGVVDFIALRDIAAGEEITVNYHGDPEATEPVWFEASE